MFEGASRFNSDLSAWNVSNVYMMQDMFKSAFSFNQDLCEWGQKADPGVDVTNMFSQSGCNNTMDPNGWRRLLGPWCSDCI
jgi:surface protein